MPRLLPLILCLLPLLANADERILSFHSDILVRQDGWIEVTETTVVRAEGDVIRRGTVRDYPTEYRDPLRNRVVVEYRPLSLLRNGRIEDFHSENRGNGVRTYFGSADRLLEPGIHTYVYRYEAGRMLGFFETHDELYWNVTGQDSVLPIDNASASVRFEFAVPPEELAAHAYSGRYGDAGTTATARVHPSSEAQFEANEMLLPGAGLTIAISWPKGYVIEPTGIERAAQLLTDNASLLVATAGLLAVLIYFTITWYHFGKDPEPGVVFTRYEPPANFSPASLRYIRKMSYDDTAMTSAVVNLAVKGYLTIQEADGIHILRRQAPPTDAPDLAAGEATLLDALFSEGDSVLLENSQHELLSAAKAAHAKSLKTDFANRYFRSNGLMILPGVLIAVASMVIALAIGGGPSPLVIASGVLMAGLIVLFVFLLKRPTIAGRKLLDELDGFREYLEIAEKDELNLRNPPAMTPQLFEKFLPFALAVGVEQRWAEKFAAVLQNVRAAEGGTWRPAWYSGQWNNGNIAASTVSLGDGLGTSISSASTPPGSASGAGGGGFSGGGGGGGGTGGW